MAKKHGQEKRSKKDNSPRLMVILIFLILIVAVGAIAVFFIQEAKQTVDYKTYNGFAFEQYDQYWITYIQLEDQMEPYEAPFYNHPLDVLDISYDIDAIVRFLSVPLEEVYIAIEPTAGSVPVLAGVNIGRITGKFYSIPTKSALYLERNNETLATYPEIPLLTCADAKPEQPIFWLRINQSETQLYVHEENQNCIIISGTDGDELLRAVDMFVYRILGIVR